MALFVKGDKVCWTSGPGEPIGTVVLGPMTKLTREIKEAQEWSENPYVVLFDDGKVRLLGQRVLRLTEGRWEPWDDPSYEYRLNYGVLERRAKPLL